MRKLLLYIFLITLIIGCNNKKKYLGHWHEFTNNNSDFGECIIITDTTFSIDKFTLGGNFDSYKDFNEILLMNYSDSLIYQKHKIKKDFIFINDSIKWVKQKENTLTFLNDFSAGLKIKIKPFINEYSIKDTVDMSKPKSHIYIGKPKDFARKNIIENQFNIQLNDKVNNNEDSLLRFLFCSHCDLNTYNYIIITDAKVDKFYINNIKKIMDTINIRESEIYFVYADTLINKYGYKNIIDINEFIK